jgi:Cu(I)/Ag(I) efflux system membrane protein CusA/SilA
MRRIAAPMVGGMVSATILTLIVIPALFLIWRGRSLDRIVAPGSDTAIAETPWNNDHGKGEGL